MRKRTNNIWRFLAVALFCVLGALPLSAQQRAVSGTVVDGDGNPLPGALVSVTGSATRAAVVDGDGSFNLQAASNETLTVTYLGFLPATVQAAQTNLVITMEPDNTRIEDVVVVGYGTQRKATLTGAVSAVNNKEITVTKNENVVNMLSGKIPGVRITQSSSQPGNFDDTKIDIRGMGDPMIVVDGVPRDKGYFSRMDASEIDNVSVLKDGSAAVYGVGAGNGVILVTTKRGQGTADEKFNITFSANYGWQNFLYLPGTLDAAAHMLLINEKQFNNIGSSYPFRGVPEYTWQEMLPYSMGTLKSTNWSEEMFRTDVPQQQYNISMDGGNDRVSYFFNVGYMDQEGSYKSGSLNYHRWNFRSNTDVKLTNRLKASVSIGGYMDERNEPNTGIWTVYKKAWTYRPTAKAWLDEEKTLPALDDFLPSEIDNPVATTDSKYTGFREYKNTNFDGSLALTYDIPGVKGLSARAFYNYHYGATNDTEYNRTYYLYSYIRNPVTQEDVLTPSIRQENSNLRRQTQPSFDETLSFSLNYGNNFGDHNVTGTLVFEQRQGAVNGFFAQRAMMLDGKYLEFGEAEGASAGQSGLSEWATRALVGRGTYNYKERYMAEFAFRYEAASNFPTLGRWGFFPSGSVAWRVSEETFVKDAIPFLSNLKLRASWGEMGGGSSTSRAVMGYSLDARNVMWLYGTSIMGGVKTNAVPNENFSWTTVRSANIGLDFDLWNGKLSGSADLFQRVRTGIPRRPDTQIPTEIGSDLPEGNFDSDKTFGWEFTLGHRNQVAGVRYWVDGQISATKNRWISRQDSNGANSLANWRRGDVSGRNKNIWFNDREEGGRFSNYDEIFWHYLPTDQGALPGDYWYQDWNGDGQINDGDNHPVATYQLPTFNYGLTIGAAWKGIDLTMNFQGAAGVYSQYDEVFTEVGPFGGGAALDFYMDRWHTVNVDDDPWNPNTQWIEGLYPATNHSFSSGTTGIRNASYLRLKTLEIGYTLPEQWLKAAGVQNLRIYVNAYNLLTFTGLDNMDPERPGGRGALNSGGMDAGLYYRYPVNRTFNVGASLKF